MQLDAQIVRRCWIRHERYLIDLGDITDLLRTCLAALRLDEQHVEAYRPSPMQ